MSRMFNLKELLEGKQSVALGGHVRPDGDCVGSTMGLYLYLKENFPQIETDLYLESVPEAYSMIRHTDEVKSELPEGKIYDLFICMDCGDLQRLGFSQKLFIESKQTACIDHHVSNEAFADVNYIVPDASSTSELVYNLLDYDKAHAERGRYCKDHRPHVLRKDVYTESDPWKSTSGKHYGSGSTVYCFSGSSERNGIFQGKAVRS